ncbi:MAG TPA: alpha/beta hydrolase [Bacteroidia bacterium]|jgi:acetyl esterase/lipase|nr:alpha/beta hydrolase [Bacteroidia bacterium]
MKYITLTGKLQALFFLPFVYFLFSFSEDVVYTPDKPPGANVRYIFKNISYGPDPANTMDLALPSHRSCAKTPLIVFIHGGAWVFGDKRFFRREIRMFADSGFACASINYRLASTERNIHHKEITSDILRALDYLKKHAAAFQISPVRVGLMGHSAGGHLAMIVSYTLNADHRIKAVVSWSGPSNFLDRRQPNGRGGPNFLATYSGTLLKTKADTLLWRRESPYYMVQRNSIPTMLIQGELDPLVPPALAVSMDQRLDSLGVKNSYQLLRGCSHIYAGPGLTKARVSTCNWFKKYL